MRSKSNAPDAAFRWGLAAALGLMMVVGAALAAPPAPVTGSAGGAQLAKSRTCLGCHQPTAKLVGPAFSSVAQRYGTLEDPVAYLTVSIRQGGRGRWGAVPMPAQPHVTQDEARELAQWILSLR